MHFWSSQIWQSLVSMRLGWQMQLMSTNGKNDPDRLNVPESTKQGKVVYNADWVHAGI